MDYLSVDVTHPPHIRFTMTNRKLPARLIPSLIASHWSVQLSLFFAIWMGLIAWLAISTGSSAEGVFISLGLAALGLLVSLFRLPSLLSLLKHGEVTQAEILGVSESRVHVGRSGANQIVTFAFHSSEGTQHRFDRRFAERRIPKDPVPLLYLPHNPTSFVELKFLPNWITIEHEQIKVSPKFYFVFLLPTLFTLIHLTGFVVLGLPEK